MIEKDCDNWKFNSNINKVIRAALNFLFFFYEKILHEQKSQKEQKTQNAQKVQKTQKAQKEQKAPKAQKAQKRK